MTCARIFKGNQQRNKKKNSINPSVLTSSQWGVKEGRVCGPETCRMYWIRGRRGAKQKKKIHRKDHHRGEKKRNTSCPLGRNRRTKGRD